MENLLYTSNKKLKVSNEQELVLSEPQSRPRNQNGKQPIYQIDIVQREQTVNRMSSSFPKGGHSATLTQLKSSRHTESESSTETDTKTSKQHSEQHQKYRIGMVCLSPFSHYTIFEDQIVRHSFQSILLFTEK